jgi:hypothetical protein
MCLVTCMYCYKRSVCFMTEPRASVWSHVAIAVKGINRHGNNSVIQTFYWLYNRLLCHSSLAVVCMIFNRKMQTPLWQADKTLRISSSWNHFRFNCCFFLPSERFSFNQWINHQLLFAMLEMEKTYKMYFVIIYSGTFDLFLSCS